jgi:hypothetical protein
MFLSDLRLVADILLFYFFSFFLSFLDPLYFHISPSSSFSFDFVPNFFIFICFVLIHFSNFLFLFQLHPPLVFLFIKFGTHSFDLIFYFVDRIFYIKFCWYNGDDKMLPTKPKKIAFGIHMMPHTPPKNHDHFPHVDACSLCARFFKKKKIGPWIYLNFSIELLFNSTRTQANFFLFNPYFSYNFSISSRISSNPNPMKAWHWEGIIEMEKKKLDALLS